MQYRHEEPAILFKFLLKLFLFFTIILPIIVIYLKNSEVIHKVNTMEIIVGMLRWIFTWLLFPSVVIGLFLYLISINIILIESSNSLNGKVRRVVGALLPFVILIFLVVAEDSSKKEIEMYLIELSSYTKIYTGAVLAFLIMESGKLLGVADLDALVATYALLVSSLLAFIFWAFIGGFLSGFTFGLMSFVITGSVHVIFRGLPKWYMKMLGDAA